MLVVAHRTCPEHAPENSIEGVEVAARLGADAVEVDVRLTRDGVPVLFHDRHLLRVAHRPLWVHRTDAARLRNHGIATLADMFARLPSGIEVAIDLKADEAALPTVAIARETGVAARVRYWTRSTDVARRLRDAVGGAEVALLRDTASPAEHERFLEDARRCHADAVSAKWEAVDRGFVDAAHERGLRVYSWCRTRGAHLEKTHLLDALITDWPDDLAARRPA